MRRREFVRKMSSRLAGLCAAFGAMALAFVVALSLRGTGNMTALAEDYYQISFDANGHGTAPAPITVSMYIDWEWPAVPTDPEYVFGGWYFEPECVTPYEVERIPETDITLYAKWMPKGEAEFRIRFMPNSGEGDMADVTVKAGTLWELPECAYAPGYGGTFRGWSVIDMWAYQDLTDYRQAGAKVLVDRDLCLMAMWTETGDAVYTITEGADMRSTMSLLKLLTYRIERNPEGPWNDLLQTVMIDNASLVEGVDYRIRKDDKNVLEIMGLTVADLSEGYHQVSFAFADGEISTSLYVESKSEPTEAPTPTEAPVPTGEGDPTATVTPEGGGDITGTPKDYEIGEKYPSKDKRDPNAGLDLPWLWIGVGAFAVVLIIVILVLLRKRRKK